MTERRTSGYAIAAIEPDDKAPVHRKGHRTRKRLLEAATIVFERDGYLGTRVADIVAEAGVSHGSFYTYFDSKDDVFREAAVATVDDIKLALDATVSTSHDPREVVRAGNLMFLNMYQEHARMLALIEQVGTSDPYFKKMREDLRGRLVRRVERAIRWMERKGQVRLEGMSLRFTAAALAGMIDFVASSMIASDGSLAEADLDTLDAIWLRALDADQGVD
ncbi:MAG: TetR/AcrR family transcriptional regulator [Nocardioides sp.]|uniref:TetR/AcrR family transcriptional regulator n=1 Tax=Nocardioides sp. TaxID=35761 RepID=UPI0039E6D513